MPRQKKQECPQGAPMWVVTYGDMMSLLLTFFILLVSLSTIQDVKFHDAAASIKEAFAVVFPLPKTTTEISMMRQTMSPPPQRSNSDQSLPTMENIGMMLKKHLDILAVSGELKIEYSSRGVKITIPAAVLFPVASSTLSETGGKVLRKIALLINSIPNHVSIEGHTDAFPIHNNDFDSNWQLSAARALAVLRNFEKSKVESQRMSFTGCGEFQPVTSNDTEKGRARNRRVEIIVLHS